MKTNTQKHNMPSNSEHSVGTRKFPTEIAARQYAQATATATSAAAYVTHVASGNCVAVYYGT